MALKAFSFSYADRSVQFPDSMTTFKSLTGDKQVCSFFYCHSWRQNAVYIMPVDKMSVNKMSVHGNIVNKMSVCAMTVEKISVDNCLSITDVSI